MSPAAAVGDDQTYALIGAAMTVHRELGYGFLEPVYQEALAREFTESGIQFLREHALQILYRGRPLSSVYRVDFLCFDEIIVELKALRRLSPVEESQVVHYLKASGLRRALILNFGTNRLEYKRLIWSPE